MRNADFSWLSEHGPELFEKYADKWIAVRDGRGEKGPDQRTIPLLHSTGPDAPSPQPPGRAGGGGVQAGQGRGEHQLLLRQ